MLKLFCILKLIIIFGMFNPVEIESNQIHIYLDNNEVKTYDRFEKWELESLNLFLPFAPSIKYGQIYVPLSPFVELFDADFSLQNQNIQLCYGDDTFTLNEHNILKNDKFFEVSSCSYLKQNEVMVPISFIAKCFNCKIEYSNNKVNIITPDIKIDGVTIDSLCCEYRMTVGGWKYEQNSKVIIHKYYKFLVEKQQVEVSAPAHYDVICFDPSTYGLDGHYTFFDKDKTLLKEVYVYSISFDPAKPPKGYTNQLIFDKTSNKWYLFDDKNWLAFQQLIAAFDGQLVENNVA